MNLLNDNSQLTPLYHHSDHSFEEQYTYGMHPPIKGHAS